MGLSSFLLGMVALYSAIKCYGLYSRSSDFKFLGFSITLGILGGTQLSLLVENILDGFNLTLYPALVIEWGHILSLAFLLSALATFIRDSKPAFAQFPKLYTFLPLFIVVSYVIVKDTYAIKEWLFVIYQGGAILISLLMYSVYTYRDNRYKTVLFGAIIFLITFVVFWYVPAVTSEYTWLWKLPVACGIALVLYGYLIVFERDPDLITNQNPE